MEKLIKVLQRDYPALNFVVGPQASWSPTTKQITYTTSEQEKDIWSLLHEIAHALLEHKTYGSDSALVRMEAEAWERAVILGVAYQITINSDYIQDSLDTYRDWLHKRSTCPTCSHHGLQQSKGLYRCLNCQDHWQVSSARFCRPYRLKMRQKA
jgi:hypothetical protein